MHNNSPAEKSVPFKSEPKFLVWENRLKQSGCTVNSITPLHIINKKSGELLFALLDTDITAPEGYSLPNIAFIRGDVCLVVPLLINKKTREECFLMVKQRRIGHGSVSLEFPAGMLDRDTNNPQKVAQKELYEETGLAISENDLFALTDTVLFSSPGVHDEGVYYYGCRVAVCNEAFNSYREKSLQNTHENEHIMVTLKTKQEAESELTSLQARLGIFLFEDYCASHGITR